MADFHDIELDSPEYYAALWREEARSVELALRLGALAGVEQSYIVRLEEAVREGTPEDVQQARLALMEEALSRLEAGKE